MSTYEMLAASSGVPTIDAPRYVALVADNADSAEELTTALAACGASAAVLTTTAEATSSINARWPDLVIVDIDFGGARRGLSLIESAHRVSDASVIVLTSDMDAASGPALSERCHVLHRPVHNRQLRTTIRLALAQREAREQLRRVADRPWVQSGHGDGRDAAASTSAATPESRVPLLHLRPRERAVVGLLLEHNRVPAVARQLGISPHTVRNHLKNIYRRLNLHSQQELLNVLTKPGSSADTEPAGSLQKPR